SQSRRLTEAEWLSGQAVATMAAFLFGLAEERELRLFACACCRAVGELLPEPALRCAVGGNEAFAGGHSSRHQWEEELGAVRGLHAEAVAAEVLDHELLQRVEVLAFAMEYPRYGADYADGLARRVAQLRGEPEGAGPTQREQCRLLCCLFGNPFRP